MLPRREFLQRVAVASTLFGLPLPLAEKVLGNEAPSLPPLALHAKDPKRFWAELRRQWLLAADHINLNCGSVGCSPLPVLRAMIDHLFTSEAFREGGLPWFGYEENRPLRELREALAAFLHCQRDEIALTRNATEGNNVICNGLDLEKGDEVVLTDQEHAGGRCCWEQKAARFGIKLVWVRLPRPPQSADEIVDLFRKAITPRTRVFSFSHITSPTGLVLPAKAICRLAREQNILSHVDGAHTIGQIPLDLHDLGCDFYATSPHKWLMAPKGTGTLFIREDRQRKLWVNTASGDWRNYEQKAYRFSNLGTSNLSVMVGMKAALEFHRQLGSERVFGRIHELASRVRERLQTLPQLKIVNSSKEVPHAGLISFEAVKGDLKGVTAACAARNIRVLASPMRIRVATHIFTQPTEVNAFFDAVEAGLRG